MSKGILIFAINSTFDYIKSAEFAAQQAKKYLNLPVTLITTDKKEQHAIFDTVIRLDEAASTVRSYLNETGGTEDVKWFNECRTLAYDLSPYDQTLLIDSDYFMFNSTLAPLFDTIVDFACFSEINDVTGVYPNQIRLSDISIPMQWATVIYFTKSIFAKSVFDFMQLIKNDWQYYSLLYHFRNHNFRNDFALSIALQALSGYSTTNFARLPGKLHTIFSNIGVESVKKDGEILFTWQNQVNKIKGTNIHCMNKLVMEKFYA